ncbi:MAG: hypothetical protein M1818_003827 [Claussenomyces sp. TS43310]|nr:MAG: hypothetical protein M1818_003827 [Claussenomyces sp. TS43310]
MLGRLFSTLPSSLAPALPSTTRPNGSLESVQEDIHTRNLLYPDAEALYEHQNDQVFPLHTSAPLLGSSLNNFDINTDIDMDLKDVRIIVMQEATSFSNSAAMMYDSHPLRETDRKDASANTQQSGSSRSITRPRRTSLGQTSKPVVIMQERESAFGRRPSTHARTSSYAETENQRSAREYREELSTFSSCIFGSSDIMSYKGTGTKMHIIPTEPKAASFDGLGSLGRSSIKSSRLAQSYTSESLHTPPSASLPKTPDRKKVVVTRIFPVPLPAHEQEGTADEYPFPDVGNAEKPKKPKQKRTPMYAIGLIIQLPVTPAAPASRSYFRGAASYPDQDSSPSSYSSLKPAGWTLLGDGFGIESLDSSLTSDVDDRLDLIAHHWDVIMRTLTDLQAIVSKNVLAMLRQVDVASPIPVPPNGHLRTGSVSIAGKRVEEIVKPYKPAGSNAKLVQLPPNSLVRNDSVKTAVEAARSRVLNGIKTFQVVTRQGRWAIWRDEARWVSKWAGGKEEGFFFYNLLTAFLGTHTEWLEALGPMWHKRRRYQQKRAVQTYFEDVPLSARTVVVAHSRDKMAARRLVFLLSAFLSPNQQQQPPQPHLSYRTARPATATSFGAHSQSPPSCLPIREGSLRRKANKKKAHSRTMSFPAQSIHEHGRRNSDLKTANLPIPGSNEGSRKSSVATTTTVTPVTTVPHFSTRRTRNTGPAARPGSSGSVAADGLIRSLKRGDSPSQWSNSTDSQENSRWGSMTSWSARGLGFWRRDSTPTTDVSQPDAEPETKKGKLAEMVEEAQRHKHAKSTCAAPEPPAEPILPAAPYQFPVKASIDEDGVIDIEVPMPDFFSPFGSTISSPSSSGCLSTHMGPGLEGFEHFSYGSADAPLNAGGWLPQYHPDFSLQAIPEQDDLEDQVKASMRAEPTPAINHTQGESRWVDISSALIADTTKFTIKRIRYRRHIKMRAEPEVDDAQSQSTSIYGNPYAAIVQTPSLDGIIEDAFTEEMVMSLDETLIEAVERIIAQPSAASTNSASSSRSTSRVPASKRRERSDSVVKETTGETTDPNAEVPRSECKKRILDALESIAKSVSDSRQELAGGEGGTAKRDTLEESFLREGVRMWLRTVEEGS